MNKEIIECIKAEKEKEARAQKDKLENIDKIKDFFKDLPEGNYEINTKKSIEKKIRDHWYSKPWTIHVAVNKESWAGPFSYIMIRKNNEIEIYDETVGLTVHHSDITNWSVNKVQIFYDHLDWFEKEIGKEYCRKA